MTRSSAQRAFLVQRLSALLLLAFVAAAALRVALGAPVSLAQWQAGSAQPLAAAALGLLAAGILAHAWVGIRDVALDYLHPPGVRRGVLAAAAAGLTLLATWTAYILVSHAL